MGTSFKERFQTKFIVDKQGCWIWIGAISMLDRHKNFPYGNISYKKKHWQAHRASYFLYRGNIPKGLEIDHLCKVTNCVNPNHLEAVTRLENVRRSSRFLKDGEKCKNGHLVVPENYKIRKEGFKRCLLCMKEANNGKIRRR